MADTQNEVLTQEVEVRETTLKTISVKLSRQVDLGYVPYIEYIKSLNGKPAPFGTRDNSRAEFDVFASAEVGTNDTVESVVRMLTTEVRRVSDQVMREAYPKAFVKAAELEVPEEQFTISKTTVERAAAGEF